MDEKQLDVISPGREFCPKSSLTTIYLDLSILTVVAFNQGRSIQGSQEILYT